MSTLKSALETFIPALHEPLRRCARRAVPVALGAPFALNTISGSLASFKRVAGEPYVDTLNYTLSDADQSDAALCSGESKSSDSKTRNTEKDAYVPLNVPLWNSKFGGFGYLPKSMAYPTNTKTGAPLMLLAQINFGELRAQWTATSHEKISSTHVFLEDPLWPTHGVLSFYTDPFDDVFGCAFSNVDEQAAFRVLYFADIEEVVNPILTKYWGGGLTLEEAEVALSGLMWTREEQYQEFEKFREERGGDCENTSYFVKPEEVSETAWQEMLRMRRELMWKWPGQDAIDRLQWPSPMAPRSPGLWYGNPINREYPMLIVPEDMPLDMVPLQSAEFKTAVVEPALAAHPEARREKAGDYFALPSQFTKDALEMDDEFGDENTYEIEYSGTTIGGFPRFTQDDPRHGDADPDMLLFGCDECSEKMMWGDAGIGNFFIQRKDLASRNFGSAWYSWDCC